MASYDNEGYGGYYIIPQYEYDREAALNADRKCRDYVRRHFRIGISNDWEATTIVTLYTESMFQAVMKSCKDAYGKDVRFNFYDIMTISSSNRVNPRAEKTGSLGVVLQPGLLVNDLIEKPDSVLDIDGQIRPCDYFLPDTMDVGMKKVIESIEKTCRLACNPEPYKIALPPNEPAVATAITYTYYIFLIQELLYKIGNSEEISETINFNECFDLNAMKDADNNVTISINIGMDGKIIGKSDKVTERDELEEDDE